MRKARKKSGPASSSGLPEEKASENLGPVSRVELPVEIIVEVISRLPVKTLLRFKCVCREWKSLISSPNFVLSTSGRERAIVMSLPLTAMAFYSINEELLITKIPCPTHDVSYATGFEFIGTYKGMAFFQANSAFWIWNPSTNSCSSFGQLDDLVYRFKQSYRTMFGVCFDKVSDDYKLVVVTSRFPEGDGTIDTIVHVASLKKGRMLTDISFPYNPPVTYSASPGVLMRGHIHWIVGKKSGNGQLIVYFDEEMNQFRELPMPEYDNDNDNGGSDYYFGLTVLDGCICMSRVAKSWKDVDIDNDENDVLVMTEYGVEHSWTKKFTIKGLLVPLPVRNSDDLVLVSRRRSLYTYDLKKKSCSVIKGPPKPLQERSYNKRHKAATGATKRYDLRDKIPQKFDSEPVVFYIYSCPVMITESLASVDCMKFATR